MDSSKLRQQQARQTRQRLLDAAWQLIGEQGYEALSAARLVRTAGVTKGALYHHFNSLEDAAYTALEQVLGKGYDATNSQRAETLEDYLDAFEQYFFQQTLADPVTGKALLSFIRVGMFNERYRQLLRQMLQQGLEKFRDDLSHYLGDQLTESQLTSLARLIDAVVGGLGVHWYTLDQQQQSWQDWQCFRAMLMAFIDRHSGAAYES